VRENDLRDDRKGGGVKEKRARRGKGRILFDLRAEKKKKILKRSVPAHIMKDDRK